MCLLLDLVITRMGKEHFRLQSLCCVTSHKALHSLEEKYLWFWVTEGRAVAAPPVFSSAFELPAGHRTTLARRYCAVLFRGK